ncbi:MAG: 2-C-methyl-D-erythritol 4-phosphate cytidylyltransferase [Porphyromonas sp.]|nr:2-C-methyl-D-erythritol 4-phosphate cytidylyltransferase [Porphyromonas sp.]
MIDLSVIIVAGGKGRRMGMDLPKQYIDISGQPVLAWTVQHLSEALKEVDSVEYILVVPKEDIDFVKQLMGQYCGNVEPLLIVAGGSERADSVMNGLLIASGRYVMVHDGVRPFVRSSLVKRMWEYREVGDVIPAIPPTDSVIVASKTLSSNGLYGGVPRENVRLKQTPQLFDRQLLTKSYELYRESPDLSCTDDSGIVEQYMMMIPLVLDGDPDNIKLTTPKDLVIAEWLLRDWNTEEG